MLGPPSVAHSLCFCLLPLSLVLGKPSATTNFMFYYPCNLVLKQF